MSLALSLFSIDQLDGIHSPSFSFSDIVCISHLNLARCCLYLDDTVLISLCLLSLVPHPEEGVPGPGADRHPILRHPQAAHPVVVARQHS